MSPRMDPATAAYVAWTEHRFYRYRGCAPDPDNPRLAAGSVERDGKSVRVPLDAWNGPDLDGGEPQKVRRERQAAAIEVCLNCPVMVACDAYANLAPAQADGVRGGRTMRERGALVAKPRPQVPVAVPADQLRTVQKLAVLSALAVYTDEYRVAIETGLDVRKANWQRARLVSGLGLEASASRMELLKAAVTAGLVDGGLVVADDGSVPAIPPATRKLLIEFHAHLLVGPVALEEAWDWSRARPWRFPTGHRPVSMRAKFSHVAGQMAFDTDGDTAAPAEDWTYVHDLFSSVPALEAAA
jgi:hypothetical protein